MSAIFISYTGRDDDGKPIAEQVAVWLREWGYESFFRDQELIEGIPAGRDWRQLLHARLAQCRLLIAVCSPKYEESAWCMAEVAIAMDRGHKLVPLVVGGAKLPLLLQNRQAITIQEPIELAAGAADEGPEEARRRIAAVQERLERALDDLLDWRAKMPRLADHTSPYPGLMSFDESTATVFYGRDEVIDALEKKVLGLPGHRSEFLLLQGASGSGKSSLLRAGLIPRLRNEKGQGFLVVDPFRLDLLPPLEALASKLGEAMVRDGVKAEFTTGGSAQKLLEDCARWRLKTQRQEAMVVVPIDQFEDLFNATDADRSDGKADQFLRFLADLLAVAHGRVLVLATIRTDYLAVLESHQARLRNEGKKLRWSAEPIPPMDPALYSEVIEGPARQTGLTPDAGLTSALVADTGSGDALPLLAFTLKELWGYHAARGFQPEQVEGVGFVHLLRRDLTTIGGVSGSVSRKADEVIKVCSEDELAALRDAFLGHLVRISEEGEGGAAKQKATLATLPPASQELVKQLVEERLLVSDAGNVEIAHEALLRTWPTLVEWIKDGQEELLQRRRVKRLSDDLKPEAPERQRRQALEQLAGLAASGGSEQRAVQKEGTTALSELLGKTSIPLGDREDAALVLALIGAEEPLKACLADTEAPPALRRRAAESLGLLARRSGEQRQRERIADVLQGLLLNSEALDVRIEVELDPSTLVPAMVQGLMEQTQRQVLEGMQQMRKAGQLPDLGEEQLREIFEQNVNRIVVEQLQQELWASGQSPGWKKHDEQLPLLQGLSRGVQLAMAPDLPLLADGPGLLVPMLTLTALEEGEGLHIRTEVVEVPVWQLPLPGGEQLELVQVPARSSEIGSPEGEDGRDVYTEFRQQCEGVDVEALRRLQLLEFALVRHPISRAQWQAVVGGVGKIELALNEAPGAAMLESLWDRHGQPGEIAIASVSWNQCQEWLRRLNRWLQEQWQLLGGRGEALQLALPSESQWEAACRGALDHSGGQASPFHFGDTLDRSWACYDATTRPFGRGRRGGQPTQPWVNGSSGLVNRLGLSELHGQLQEWCADQWHPDPVAGALADGSALEGPDPRLANIPLERDLKLLRGGAWDGTPRFARAAMRNGDRPVNDSAGVGLRPGCFAPPGSLLGA